MEFAQRLLHEQDQEIAAVQQRSEQLLEARKRQYEIMRNNPDDSRRKASSELN